MTIITVGDLRNDPSLLEKLGGGIPDGVHPGDYDPINTHHPDNLAATLAKEEWIKQAAEAIEDGRECVGALSTVTGESILKIL